MGEEHFVPEKRMWNGVGSTKYKKENCCTDPTQRYCGISFLGPEPASSGASGHLSVTSSPFKNTINMHTWEKPLICGNPEYWPVAHLCNLGHNPRLTLGQRCCESTISTSGAGLPLAVVSVLQHHYYAPVSWSGTGQIRLLGAISGWGEGRRKGVMVGGTAWGRGGGA